MWKQAIEKLFSIRCHFGNDYRVEVIDRILGSWPGVRLADDLVHNFKPQSSARASLNRLPPSRLTTSQRLNPATSLKKTSQPTL